MFGFSSTQLIFGLIQLACFVPAIVVHEVSHGFAAYKLGDPTAKSMGRLSLNPIKHIDVFGTIILPILLALVGGPVFGYAKPVPYDPRYFKNLKKGEVITGMAGPASNLAMALLTAGVAFVLVHTGLLSGNAGQWVFIALYYFTFINLILMFFNLIPLPPLDGSSLIVPFLPQSAIPTWYNIQRMALPIFFIVIFVVPQVFHVNPIYLYLDVTAGNLIELLFFY
ncbi:MAG: site-2 protease family protein [Coriobacteriia bacterium]|nr:site-2 protease family protein [Coriobacteriia bacterium]